MDFRLNSVGSLLSALDIYEMAVIPFLLFNSNTWYFMNKNTINMLENLQLKMFRCLFAVPDATPKPMLRFDLGSLTIVERINISKLTFLHFFAEFSRRKFICRNIEVTNEARISGPSYGM